MILIAADDRSYLTAEEQQRYVIGDPAAPLLTFGVQDEHGVMWLTEEPQGWDAPAVATPVDRRQAGHGGYIGESYYEERVLSFQGSAACPTIPAARAARDRLRSAILSTMTGLIPYWHLDDDPAKSLLVRASGQPRIAITEGRWLDYSFELIAEDPFKRGEERTYGPVRLPGLTGATGRSYGRSYPYSYDQLIGSGAPFVENAGDEDAHARYVITGPVVQPLVQVGLTGEWFSLAVTLAGAAPGVAADVAVVDTAAGTVTINGVLAFDTWVNESTFPLIPARGGIVRLRSRTGDTNQTGTLTVITAPTWK